MRGPGRLARKYLVIMVALVTGVLLASGAIEIYASYYENKAALGGLQREKAGGAASSIESFVREIERQLGWTTQPLLVPPAAAIEQRRLDAVRLQRQVLSITEVSHLDAAGREQLRVSRLAMDVIGGHADFSGDPKFTVAKSGRTYFGPVYFRKESEPYMTIAMPQSGGGVTVAEVNLKFIWDVVSQIKVGKAGLAYVVDGRGALIAHPDISLVLQKTNLAGLAQVKAALAPAPGDDVATIGKDPRGRDVLAAHSAIAPLGWVVLVEQPLDEAFAPLRASAYRTMVLVALGIVLSAVASAVLARRLAKPIQALQVSAAKIGAGELDHQITIRTGDELESLADEFNRMTGRLRESYANLEQKVEDRTRELSEALDQQTATAEILRVISSSPTDIQPVMTAVAEAAARLTDASRALIGRVEGESFRWLATNEGRLLTNRLFPISRALPSGRAILDRQTTQEPDLSRLVDELPHLADVTQVARVRTALATPLLREGVSVGVLMVYRTEVLPFTDKQIMLLQTFAAQAVIAIENVRLFKELEARNADLTEALDQQTATADILRVISSSPTDLQPVMEALVQSAAVLCEAQNAQIFRVEDRAMRLVARYGPVRSSLEAGQARPITRGSVSGRTITDCTMLHIPDLLAEVDGAYPDIAEAIRREGIRTTVGVPLMREGVPIGSITAFRTERRPFTDKQIALLQTFADQAVIAIENVRLFKELEEKNRTITEALDQQTATAEILRVISSSPTDVQPVLDAVAENATRVCEAGDGAVLLIRDGAFRITAHYGTISMPYDEAIPIVRGTVAGRAVLESGPVHVPDVLAAGPDFPEAQILGSRFGNRTTLATPLLREGSPIGALLIRRIEVRPFTDKQIALLQTFADQAVIAIENVRLFKELEARNADLTEALDRQTGTAEILRVISSSPTDVQPVFDAIVTNAVRLCGGVYGMIWRYDGTLVDLVGLHNLPTEGREQLVGRFPRPLDALHGPLPTALRTGSVVEIPDVSRYDDPAGRMRELWRARGVRSVVMVPMRREGAVVGAIGVSHPEVGALSANRVELLKTFADQAVIAIENVRLFKELEARNSALTESLEQQTATAEILRVISSSPTDLQPVMDTVAENAARVCGAMDAGIFRIEGDQLRRVARFGSSIAVTTPETVPLRRDRPTGRAIIDRQVVHIEDLQAVVDTEFPTLVAQARASGVHTLLAAPLVREGASIGAILIRRAEVRPFTDKQIALLQTFADQAVIAIENVRLFQELQARTADLTRSVGELEALGEVGRTLSATLDLPTVLTTIVTRAVELAGTSAGMIFEFEEGESAFRMRAAHNMDQRIVDMQHAEPVRLGEGAVGRAVQTRSPAQIEDLRLASQYTTRQQVRQTLIELGYRSVLAVPLLVEERILGALVVFRRDAGGFALATVDLLRTFGTQSALAIQNARLFREIETKSRELQIANQHKDEFLASMSHELRTPLNAIIGFSEVMLERLFGDVNAKQEEYLHDILSSGRHLLSLINDILDLAKIEAGRMELEPADFDLPQAIDNALVLVRERAMRRGITLEQSIDPRLGEIKGDERKVKQVMLNLLSNAVKFTPEGGRIDVRAVLADGVAQVSVADTGVGIAPEDHAAVFEEFRQVGTDYARKHEGTGLGLALARKFVELHGGTIRVDSQLGQGATFTFTIPVTPWQAS